MKRSTFNVPSRNKLPMTFREWCGYQVLRQQVQKGNIEIQDYANYCVVGTATDGTEVEIGYLAISFEEELATYRYLADNPVPSMW